MKNHFSLFFSAIAALALGGCALNVQESNFYKVEYYSDYVGIDEDLENKSLDTSKATLLGHAYAKKESTSHNSDSVEITTYYGVSEPTKLEEGIEADKYRNSKREVPVGHEWKFDRWAGFYADGNAVDLSQIKGDCSVFAIYKAVPIVYSVIIEGYESNERYYRVPYGKTLSENEDYLANPITSNPVSYYGDHYYETSLFDRMTYVVGDVDHSSEITGEYYDFLANVPIVGETRFVFKYQEAVKHQYTVRFRCLDEENPSTRIYPASEEWEEQVVEYNQPLVKPASILSTEWRYVSATGTYGDEAKADNPVLNTVDIDCIRHNCEVTLYYRHVAQSHSIRIYDETGMTVTDTITVFEGGSINLPEPVVGSDYTFTGEWVIKDSSPREIFDGSIVIDKDYDLVPSSVLTNQTKTFVVEDQNSHSDVTMQAKYRYNRTNVGYLLSGLEEVSGATDESYYHLSADDLNFSTADNYAGTTYSLIGVQSFGGSAIAQKIYEVALPTSLRFFQGVSFRGLSNISSLDLSGLTSLTSIGDMAFDRMSMLAELYLPSSLTHVGRRIVNDCTSLEDGHLHINKTSAQVAALVESNDFDEEWNYRGDSTPIAPAYLV